MFLPTLSILSVAGFAGEDLRCGVGGSGGRGGAGPVHGGPGPQLDQGRDGVRGHPQDRQGDHALQGKNKCVQMTQQNKLELHKIEYFLIGNIPKIHKHLIKF